MPTRKPRLSVTVDEDFKSLVDQVATSAGLDTSDFVRLCVEGTLQRLGDRRGMVDVFSAISAYTGDKVISHTERVQAKSEQVPAPVEERVQAKSEQVPAPVEEQVQAKSEQVQARFYSGVGGRRNTVHIVKHLESGTTYCNQSKELKNVNAERSWDEINCGLCKKFYA